MATEVTKVVDPDNGSGTDYTSLDAWEDDFGSCTSANYPGMSGDGDLVTADLIAVAQCRASSGNVDSTPLNITGWYDTSSTQYIQVELHNDETNNGAWNSSNYTLEIETGELGFGLEEDFIRVQDIQLLIKQAGDTDWTRGFYCFAGVAADCDIRIDSCFLKHDITVGSTKACYSIHTTDNDALVTVFNCIIIDNYISGDSGYRAAHNQGSDLYLYNCTIHNCANGPHHQSGTTVAKNCIVFDCDDDFSGGITLDYIMSDDDHSGDCANYWSGPYGADWANEFTDYGSDDFSLKTGGNAIGNGLDDPSSGKYSDDIAGTTRTSTWDIGAFEGTAPAGDPGIMTLNTGYWGPTFNT